jgi:LDH2 family malate/lactate/ureidoglycolate dehydrogenase
MHCGVFTGQVPIQDLIDVTRQCLMAEGATAEHAAIVADVLVAADCRGVPSHGVNRLEV